MRLYNSIYQAVQRVHHTMVKNRHFTGASMR
jgi:hypothetical protein